MIPRLVIAPPRASEHDGDGEGPTLSTTDQPAGLHFDLADCWWASRLLLRTLKLRSWRIATLAFAAYYLLPLAIAAVEGVLVSPRAIELQFEPIGLGRLARWLSQRGAIAGSELSPLYYAGDFVHLAMATVMLLVGGTLMAAAVDRFGGVFDYLMHGGQVDVPAEIVAREVARAKHRCRSVWIQGLISLVSLLLGAFLLLRVFDPTYQWWWGQLSYGPAGLVFALVATSIVSGGAMSVYLLAVGLSTISRLLAYPLNLQPFHHDGCNGFGRFGAYLILLFALSVMMATSTWITFWGGYLGIERFVASWFMGAGVVLAIPLILIAPLVRCTVQISRARRRRLAGLQKVMERRLLDIESRVTAAGYTGVLRQEMQNLLDTRKAIAEVYGSNNFPFKLKVAGSLSLGYLIQVALIVKQAIDKWTAQ